MTETPFAQPSGAAAWTPVNADANFLTPVSPGTVSPLPGGQSLDLHMGWDRYENFALALIRLEYGARDVRFRRYGVQGQSQHGIDLAGRFDGTKHVVVQCKDYATFTAASLRAAVETFTSGKRPFNASTFIVMTSASTQSTQCADELEALRDEHPDLTFDLWGSEVTNDLLRNYPDIVGRFWTRETADVFCTGAPLPGLPAAPPDRQAQAERILLGPQNSADIAPLLQEADATKTSDPAGSATLFGEIAERLEADHFHGHAFVIRRRQLDVLAAALMTDEAISLAADLAVVSLMRGQRDTANELARLTNDLTISTATLIGPPTAKDDAVLRQRQRHVDLIDAAVHDTARPLGSPARLIATLPAVQDITDPGYHPTLVLYLGEDLLATEPHQLSGIDNLITVAVEREMHDQHSETLLRLRLLRAEYDPTERLELNKAARRHLVPRHAAALIAAREARRCAHEGRADEALEAWRDAISDGIEADLVKDAADWLYAIRGLNLRYGPWTDRVDDEHRLAQALKATGSGSALQRTRNPRESAMAATVNGKQIAAVLDTRRWLIDACVTGSWASEAEAVRFLADRYAASGEAARAAMLFQRGGESKKVQELAAQVGDMTLPLPQIEDQPWWVLNTILKQVSAQEDLLDTDTARKLLVEASRLARLGQTGELLDSPAHYLSTQALNTTCDLAHRGTSQQANDTLDLLSPYVHREPSHGYATDARHSACCVPIALAHPALAYAALKRLLDLAEADAQDAQKALIDDTVAALITGQDPENVLSPTHQDAITKEERTDLISQVTRLAEQGRYLSDILLESVAPEHELVHARAVAARDRILGRPDPLPGVSHFGTGIAKDAYLASLLPADEAHQCLEKLMEVAADHRENASTRQDALLGARNLVLSQPADIKADIFQRAQVFVTGDKDGSAFDQFTGKPHPLSAAKIDIGPASLRGDGLRLAHAAAHEPDNEQWILRQAITFLDSHDPREVHSAALVIHQLPVKVTTDLDAVVLASHQEQVLRQVAVALAVREPERYADLLLRQAQDNAYRVRRNLAESLARTPLSPALMAARDLLQNDRRHSVRTVLNPAVGDDPSNGAPPTHPF